MRIKKDITNIDYTRTKSFFQNRASKYREDNPYSVTMYQDNNADLVRMRNEKEMNKLIPRLKLSEDSKVLDIACGIGRWADRMPENIREYFGVDFSDELVSIANKRNHRDNISFAQGAASEIEEVLKKSGKGKFNRALLIGILMYLNEADVKAMFEQLERVCEEHAVICVREPIGLGERLTLQNFYSDELKDDYNAIYRTRDEIIGFLQKSLLDNGFEIKEEGFLFDEDQTLNNRKETAQYYFILER